eukprot:s2765_g8.t1
MARSLANSFERRWQRSSADEAGARPRPESVEELQFEARNKRREQRALRVILRSQLKRGGIVVASAGLALSGLLLLRIVGGAAALTLARRLRFLRGLRFLRAVRYLLPLAVVSGNCEIQMLMYRRAVASLRERQRTFTADLCSAAEELRRLELWREEVVRKVLATFCTKLHQDVEFASRPLKAASPKRLYELHSYGPLTSRMAMASSSTGGEGSIYVFLEVEISGVNIGRMIFKLYDTICPKTAENFRCLCNGERGQGLITKMPLTFQSSKFHRLKFNRALQVLARVPVCFRLKETSHPRVEKSPHSPLCVSSTNLNDCCKEDTMMRTGYKIPTETDIQSERALYNILEPRYHHLVPQWMQTASDAEKLGVIKLARIAEPNLTKTIGRPRPGSFEPSLKEHSWFYKRGNPNFQPRVDTIEKFPATWNAAGCAGAD